MFSLLKLRLQVLAGGLLLVKGDHEVDISGGQDVQLCQDVVLSGQELISIMTLLNIFKAFLLYNVQQSGQKVLINPAYLFNISFRYFRSWQTTISLSP